MDTAVPIQGEDCGWVVGRLARGVSMKDTLELCRQRGCCERVDSCERVVAETLPSLARRAGRRCCGPRDDYC